MNMDALIAAQEMFSYFDMLSGPTYVKLVKDFWIRAEVYDVDAAKDEELQAVIKDPSLRGKTRKEMGLESFRQTEIRSAVMGIPTTITEKVIAKACRVTATGRFIWNANRNHPLLDSYKGVVLKGNSSTKLVDIDGHHRMLLKFMTECFFQKYESQGFVMTPEMARKAQKQIDEMMAVRKKEKAALKAARDAKLQSIGIDGCDEFYLEKLAEVKQIADSVEQFAVKEAEEMLEKIPEASEADALEAAPESTTVAEASEASAKVTQTSDLPFIIATHISPSNESDHDNIPLGQRMKKLHKPSPQPQQITKQPPLQAEQSSAAAEGFEAPEEPNSCDLSKCDSPSNLFSLERHLGGEITKTPQKAIKSVPKRIDLVNQQQPKQTHQTTPKQTSTSTPTQTQTQTSSSLQMAIPEPVVETVVPESVQVTESEQTVTITVSEQIQKPTQTQPTAITNDQPSSSSSIQTVTQTPPNILKSEFLEAEMQQISNELQRLVQLRRSPTLKIAYQEQWVTLKNRASELLKAVSQKCIKIQTVAYMHHVSIVHIVEDQAPRLYLANTPYFSESDYLTREARIFKLLKQKIVKQQEDVKAREDLLLQKQLELEATLKSKEDLIAQLMNKQA